jgi:hypothetical protein
MRSAKTKGITKAFVKTFRRDYLHLSILPNVIDFRRLSA